MIVCPLLLVNELVVASVNAAPPFLPVQVGFAASVHTARLAVKTTVFESVAIAVVVVAFSAGSRVTSFDVASYASRSQIQMCVEEVAADGTVGATLVAWKHYGTRSGGYYKPLGSDYTPATIAVETTATRFRVSARHTCSYSANAGVAIFHATGVAP